ncbi:hypothetical protein RvY_08568 [Ramazzottius varieornatus]|uniref:Essential protein Yae1 N-terminal domain-containing protein n=1 Tax=Ramazzottius varieornatus TaxID=947166 RepID=A0A1D1VBX5_RAMVA|nr:hypothetical protein RvY_08568 [Ramazzottius varieornatus]
MPRSTGDEEEWFDEEATDPEDQEFNRLQQSVWKEGYKQGLESSRDQSLQKAFEEGFASCVDICLALGQLKGELRAFLHYAKPPTYVEKIDSAKALLQDIETFEERSRTISVPESAKEDISAFQQEHEARRKKLQQEVGKFVSRGACLLTLLQPQTTGLNRKLINPLAAFSSVASHGKNRTDDVIKCLHS